MASESDSGAHAAGGLITQRMAAERGRVTATVYLLWGAMLLATAVTRGVPSETVEWVLGAATVIPGAGLIVFGVLALRARRRRISEFEARHGVGAGQQTPVARGRSRTAGSERFDG